MAPRNSAFCLVSHKCNPRNHEVCREIGILLRQNDVEPLIDPFGPGDVVDSRIETLDFHTVLFLFCNESLESRACRYELDCAQRRLTPIFVVRLTQDVLPNALSGRIYVNLSSAEGLTFEREMKALARAIRERGRLYARIVSLGSENFPEVARETAKDVGTKFEKELLAEFVDLLARHYTPGTDSIARYWIAIAIGKAGTQKAAAILRQLVESEPDPYPKEGIREALETIERESIRPLTRAN